MGRNSKTGTKFRLMKVLPQSPEILPGLINSKEMELHKNETISKDINLIPNFHTCVELQA